MLIVEQALSHWINNFYGYGSWRAKMWFVSHDDSGGDMPEEVAEKINYFFKEHPSTSPTLCDIREMYRQVTSSSDDSKANLFPNHYEYRFGVNAIQDGAWKNLIAFQSGYRNEPLPDLLGYQKHIFASAPEHHEALIRLYPLPAPHSHAWYYNWLDMQELGFLKSRASYKEHVYQSRIHTLLSNIREYKPEVVLMYGMDNINALKKSVQDFFHSDKFQMIKAMKRQTPQHHRADINGTIILITTQVPTLRHNRVETGFDWQEFGRAIKVHSF